MVSFKLFCEKNKMIYAYNGQKYMYLENESEIDKTWLCSIEMILVASSTWLLWIKKLWYSYTMELYTAAEKEGAYTLCNSMDGTGEHYAKWNKQGGEGQIPYDLTFNWNIINKRKKTNKV